MKVIRTPFVIAAASSNVIKDTAILSFSVLFQWILRARPYESTSHHAARANTGRTKLSSEKLCSFTTSNKKTSALQSTRQTADTPTTPVEAANDLTLKFF
jgi:hypothetical protein